MQESEYEINKEKELIPALVEFCFGFSDVRLSGKKLGRSRFFIAIEAARKVFYRRIKGFNFSRRSNSVSINLEDYQGVDGIYSSVPTLNGVSVEYDDFDLPVGVTARPARKLMDGLGSFNVFFKRGDEKAEYLPRYAIFTDKNGGCYQYDEATKLKKYGTFNYEASERLSTHPV